MKLGTSADGHESFTEIAQEINGIEPILSKICIVANVQESVILHCKTFISAKHMPKLKNYHWPEN
jgi:hypothetical protein